MKALWMTLALCGAVFGPAQSRAQDAVARAMQESEALVREAGESQQRIDQLDDEARQMLSDYRQAIQRHAQLVEHNQQLEATIGMQQAELETLRSQLGSVSETEHAIMPLLTRMVASLERFVSLDLPFQLSERQQRVAQLKDLLISPTANVAEKYRRVLEAYQIESDYGRTLEAWRGPLEANDMTRVVDFLRLGRVMLFYQTPDGSEQGYWDRQTERWAELPATYRRSLEQGLRIARQQQTPVMLRLPLPPVQAQEDTP